jgi:hypothetical protein
LIIITIQNIFVTCFLCFVRWLCMFYCCFYILILLKICIWYVFCFLRCLYRCILILSQLKKLLWVVFFVCFVVCTVVFWSYLNSKISSESCVLFSSLFVPLYSDPISTQKTPLSRVLCLFRFLCKFYWLVFSGFYFVVDCVFSVVISWFFTTKISSDWCFLHSSSTGYFSRFLKPV